MAMPSHQGKRKHGVLLLHGEPENTMKCRKALLSEEELLVTKERDKDCKASKRASETREQTLHRTKHMASIRASETFEHTVHRQQ